MESLKKHFLGRGEVKGFKFTQITCTNRAFLYEINTGDAVYYEVFKSRQNKRFGVVSYPTSKAFGHWAWTYQNLDKAIYKFNLLNSGTND